MSGSDFDDVYFSATERTNFQPLLNRLRSFEKTVARSFRQFEERLNVVEENVKTNKNGLSGTKGSVTKLRNSLKTMENFVKEKLNQNINFEENQSEDEPKIDLEVKVGDPFLNNGSFIPHYDGNPSISFSKWIEKFKDILTLLTTPLTEAQKLARLRFCLDGQARTLYDSIDPAPNTLEEAIQFLKTRFENGNTKIIARQALSICKQAPGEPVFDFSNRLNEAVRAALSGENEQTIKKRLLEEFLDRITPELQFQVKAQRPTDADLAEKVDALTINKNKPDVITCYCCRRPGHIARNCPENQGNFNRNYRRNNNYNPRNNYNARNYDNRQRYYQNRSNYNPNYNGGHRNHYSNSNYRQNNYEQYEGQRRNNYRNYNNSNQYTSNSRDSSRSSGSRRVKSERRSSPSIRVISPLLLALLALLSVFSGTLAHNPMICLNDAPKSLWKFPDTNYPNWQPTAELTHEIIKLTSKSSVWQNPSSRSEAFASNIIAKCLFAFLTGGIFPINIVVVFAFCCYVTLKFVLPAILAQTIGYLNIGERIYQYTSTKKGAKKIEKFKLNNFKIKTANKDKLVPIGDRWPYQNFGEENPKNKLVEVMTAGHQCDENMRVLVEINGQKLICLLDTGAHISLVGNKTAKRLGITDLYQPDCSGVIGIGNKVIPAIGQSEIILKIANIPIKTKLTVVNDVLSNNGTYSVIIGRESLKKMPLLLNLMTGELINSDKLKNNLQKLINCSLPLKEQSGENLYRIEDKYGSERISRRDQMRIRRGGLRNKPTF
uniref:CCHC-type domain-containing protein n=1 Tax=Meloidogyne enterolobii TaxID=390850 RepID=A0A6V7YB01_MELEN|nr:unnamed protein product [Meloidogyne enterolobii]